MFLSIQRVDSAAKEGAYARSMEHLNEIEVCHIFDNLNETRTLKQCPHLPKSSYVYVLDTRGDDVENWKVDGYVWKCIGTKQYLNGKITKEYYSSLLDNKHLNLNFQRVCFKCENKDFVIVQYVGDNKPTSQENEEKMEEAKRKREKEISDEGCNTTEAKEIYKSLCKEKMEKIISAAREQVSFYGECIL